MIQVICITVIGKSGELDCDDSSGVSRGRYSYFAKYATNELFSEKIKEVLFSA